MFGKRGREPWTKRYSSGDRRGYKGCTVWIATSAHCFTPLNCHGFMVMFYTFLLPDYFPAIKQPEGIKKELTQSSLVCTKGKASSFFHSRESVELLHWLVGFVLQNQRPFQGRKEDPRVEVLGYRSGFSEIPLARWASLCSIFFTQTADSNSHCSNVYEVKTFGKKLILTILVVTFSHQA